MKFGIMYELELPRPWGWKVSLPLTRTRLMELADHLCSSLPLGCCTDGDSVDCRACRDNSLLY